MKRLSVLQNKTAGQQSLARRSKSYSKVAVSTILADRN